MEQVSFGGILVNNLNIIHDSAKEIYRHPLGAVPCCEEVSLALKVAGLHIEQATLCVLREGVGIERHDMHHDDGMMRVGYTVPEACASGGCVLWYWFEIVLQGGPLCYYGAELPYASGLGCVYHNPPPAFQLTVYDGAFDTPEWAKSAIMYQIFPDRFHMGDPDGVRAGIAYHRDKGRTDIELHEDWDDLPVYEPRNGQSYYMPCDIFGGDLEGVRQKLSYLKSMGVTLIYLNPIFEASSNHRYNTGDYLKIDPILGDAEGFRRLADEARAAGIRIVLDGVFSHTGDDSIYFNKYGRYDGLGAYQSTESPYYSWYHFDAHPDRYTSWWGFESLPEVNEHDPGWQDFVINGQESVVRHWIGEGAAGYRLDVADELPDDTIGQIRRALKDANPDAFLLGEVWEDATTKQGYGKPRTYALGRGLDSVMNYPFTNRTLEFLKGKIDALLYCKFLAHQRHTYPAPMYYTLMNLISSHDICRTRTMLSRDFDVGDMSRAEQAVFELSADEYELGGRRQRLAAAIQFSLPGIPAVYYGDEVGMTGLLDPFNRKAWCEEDSSIIEWYKWLGDLRTSRPVLCTGHVWFFATDGNVLGILRHTVGGCDFFGKEIGSDAVLTVVNPTDRPHRIVLDLGEIAELMPDGRMGAAIRENTQGAVSLLTGREAALDKGLIEIDMAPLQADVFGVV
ncbi:MAG: glycoside hydrolase family 13 protein [Clostridiales bacterium]|nr:glycoside hydrolase family 13 protein [Clostridiales bacterium]